MKIHASLWRLLDASAAQLKSNSKDGKDGKDGKDDSCLNAWLPAPHGADDVF